jgi:hypothetical protein
MKQIIITVDENGNSSIDLQGFHGKGCAEVMKALRGSDTVRKSITKPEYAEQEQTQKVKAQS